MRFTNPSGVLLLQATAFFSGVNALCRPACASDDALLVVLRSADAGVFFCSAFLGVPVSTVSATVTPTVVATVTDTSYGTVTVTVTDPTTSVAPVRRKAAKRSLAYPTWLPTTYPAQRVSSACACLSVPASVSTSTATAAPATLTASVTVTEITTSTLHSTSTAVVSQQREAKIEILRKDTQLSVGWLYNSNGPAVGTAAQAITVNFTLSPGATTGSQVRINLEGITPPALGFVKSSNPSNVVELEDSYGSLSAVQPTPPGSRPVSSGNDKYESDIWTVDTNTQMIGWQWIATSGALPTIYMYRVGGRLYPVGNVNAFNQATGGVSTAKYEVIFRYSLVSGS
ncbi:hypothetical protein BR93DRAFT_149647 [Coniochaeta sp. PMI_546]|nr:hypothetical protein BR93DRAFT_149647 [Coniochaeta sp. PMI_546]